MLKKKKKRPIMTTEVYPDEPTHRPKKRARWRGMVVLGKKGLASVQPENGWSVAKTQAFLDRTFPLDAPHAVFMAVEERHEPVA